MFLITLRTLQDLPDGPMVRNLSANAGNTDLIPDLGKTKAVKRDKEGHYIMIKGSVLEDITIINIYAPNIGASQYVRHKYI